MKYKVVIFDFDGTLADTMEPHAQTWVEELARYGCTIEKSLIYELAGMPGRKTVMEINRRFGLSLPPDEIAEKKEELFESFKKIDINLNLNVDEQLFQKKWENKSYDIISSKRKLRSISLIREIHRDMVCARFMSNQIIYVKIFLKFLENLNQYLLIKSYLNNINI